MKKNQLIRQIGDLSRGGKWVQEVLLILLCSSRSERMATTELNHPLNIGHKTRNVTLTRLTMSKLLKGDPARNRTLMNNLIIHLMNNLWAEIRRALIKTLMNSL
jgi:hypothetical protein